jgi:energy-coupling factor transport system substrate-specific component
VASLSAANVAFRFALSWGPPNVKPTAFVVIIGGIIGGPFAGFAIGWFSMVVSDLVSPYGAGVWTLETSSFMGIVGLLAGLFWHYAGPISRWKLTAGGFILTVIYDIGTSVADAILFSYPWVPSILALYVPFLSGSVSPYPFGFADELTTAILLAVIGPSIIIRIRKIY